MAQPQASTGSPTHDPLATVVELVDVVSAVGNFPVLAGVDLSVDAGEIVLVRGANGAGKTSLLRLCAGFLPVTRGRARVCGFDIATQGHLVGRSVGMLGHRNGLYLGLTARENLRFWAAAVGATSDEADAALERVGVTGRLGEVAVSTLSVGQKRRTALAAMIVRRARLWLLDEPHAGLDAEARDELDSILIQAAEAGATVILASHELDRAARVSQRHITVAAGRVVADSAVRPRSDIGDSGTGDNNTGDRDTGDRGTGDDDTFAEDGRDVRS